MLLEKRLEKKISREKLAKKCNIDARTIYRIEKNECIPLLDTYAKIVIALGLNEKEIYENIKEISETKEYTTIK